MRVGSWLWLHIFPLQYRWVSLRTKQLSSGHSYCYWFCFIIVVKLVSQNVFYLVLALRCILCGILVLNLMWSRVNPSRMQPTPFRHNFASTVYWINCFLDTSVVVSCCLFFSLITVKTTVLLIATWESWHLVDNFHWNPSGLKGPIKIYKKKKNCKRQSFQISINWHFGIL